MQLRSQGISSFLPPGVKGEGRRLEDPGNELVGRVPLEVDV